MKKYWILFSLILLTTQAPAALDYGVELGPRQQSGDVAGVNFAANTQWGLQVGFFSHIPIDSQITHFRTGALYTQRPLQSENTITGDRITYFLDYLDIPIQILLKPKENFGFYFGVNAGINLTKSCSGNDNCKIYDVDTPYFPVVFGGTFKFGTKWGANVYIEGANGAVAQGLGNYKAFGVNLMYSID